ncbi:MAG: HAMP domain-containing sensor histidine kinase [Pseudomonadota bacterium]
MGQLHVLNAGQQTTAKPNLLGAYASSMGDAVRRHRSNVALKAAAVRTQLAHRARNEFVANMNHELRTPLNAIIGFAGMLREAEDLGLSVQKRDEYCVFVLDSAHRLLDLLGRVLDFAALESGRFQPEAQPLDLIALVSEAVREMHPNVSVSVEMTRATANADPSAVVKVLDHLLRNAAKFAGDGAKAVVRIAGAEDGTLWVSVEDDGVGMSREELAIALDPFTQVSSGLDRLHDGIGLGLTLSRMYVEAMGGKLVVRSQKGRGTQAAFSLPATTEKPQPTDVVATIAAVRGGLDAEAPTAPPPPVAAPAARQETPPASPSDDAAYDAEADDDLEALFRESGAADDDLDGILNALDDGAFDSDIGEEPAAAEQVADSEPARRAEPAAERSAAASLTAEELQRNTTPEMAPFTDPEAADPDHLFTSGGVFDPAALFEDEEDEEQDLDEILSSEENDRGGPR